MYMCISIDMHTLLHIISLKFLHLLKCVYLCLCMYVCMRVYVCVFIWCSCVGQKTICRSGFFPSTVRILGSRQGHHWWQGPSPAELAQLPCLWNLLQWHGDLQQSQYESH